MPKILESLLDVAISDNHALKVDSQNNLVVGEPNWLDRAKMSISIDEYSHSKVAAYLSEHSREIYSELDEYPQLRGKISPLQKYIDDIFKANSTELQKPDLISHAYSDWMGKLSEEQKNKAFLQTLFLPGTHDSAAYQIDWTHPISSSEPSFLSIGSNILNYTPGINNLVSNWTITQSESIVEQLNHGIRLFDLRIAYNESDHKFYLSHTFTVGSLEDTLSDFSKFLSEHSSEVAVINIKPDYIHRSTIAGHEKELSDLIEKYLGSTLIDQAHKNITLNQAEESHKNAIVVYQGNSKNLSPNIWNAHSSKEIWQNKGSITNELEALNKTFDSEYKNFGHMIDYASFTVTPDQNTILSNTSLHTVSQDLNGYIKDFISEHPYITTQLNGLIVDHPSYDVIETIIETNHTLDH